MGATPPGTVLGKAVPAYEYYYELQSESSVDRPANLTFELRIPWNRFGSVIKDRDSLDDFIVQRSSVHKSTMIIDRTPYCYNPAYAAMLLYGVLCQCMTLHKRTRYTAVHDVAGNDEKGKSCFPVTSLALDSRRNFRHPLPEVAAPSPHPEPLAACSQMPRLARPQGQRARGGVLRPQPATSDRLHARLSPSCASNRRHCKAAPERIGREREYSATNKLKIQNNWRKIMRLAKVVSRSARNRGDLQNHERDVDRKDAIVQMLDRDLEESEEQHQMALRSHLQNIDVLIDLQDARLLALENDFEADLRTLEDEFNAEREEIEKQHATEQTELLDIMSAVEADERERETEARHEHEQIREEIAWNTEEINVLRITLESQIEELERHFESAHLNYLQNTDQRTQDFKYLTTQDQTLSKDIEIKLLKIERLKQSLRTGEARSARTTASAPSGIIFSRERCYCAPLQN